MAKRTALIKFVIIAFSLFIPAWVNAQSVADSNYIDISDIQQSMPLNGKCQVYPDTNNNLRLQNFSNIDWQKTNATGKTARISEKMVTIPIFIKLNLQNTSDSTVKIYFLAGSYIRKLSFFKIQPNKQPIVLKDESRGDGFQPLLLAAGEKATFIVKFNFAKIRYNYFKPILVNEHFLINYQVLKEKGYESLHIVGYLLGGILLMMIFFTGVNFLITRKREFLYNCCYSICMFFLIFLNTFLERKNGFFSSFFQEYLDFMLLATGTIFYIAFTRKFLGTSEKYPLLNKIFIYEEKALMIILAGFTSVVFFTNNFHLQEILENGMKAMVLLMGIVYIVIAFFQKDRLMNYLAIGNALLIFFSLISFALTVSTIKKLNIFNSSIIYYEIGIVSELVFFLLGLSYKNRIELIGKIKEQEAFKLEAEKQSYETKLAILNVQQAERNRISADMHDDLGAGVTAIRLYSELAKKRIGKEVVPEIEKISSSANDLLNNMNAIIWTMSSSNDSLQNMIAYIRSYALEYFENTGIDCRIQIEENIPNIAVSGELRRNIYLVVKEALSNILKHSKATGVSIILKREKKGISLYIHDDGIGIDLDNLREFGNGLKNMKKRMQVSQIQFSIENKNGTLIHLYSDVEF